ncbi:MAG TPA: SoxR reducing system RseC family protein [Burkholderiales bacterium]|nr:SoxR reducing system RseC family protein [Burkholderiales bacterium]
MNETPAVVVHTEGEYALVEAQGASGCGRCEAVGGCASARLGRLFCATPRRFRVLNRLGARPGERVVLAVREGALLRSAGAAYGVPLLLVVAGAMFGAWLGASPRTRDLYAAAGATLGLVAGLAGIRLFDTLGRGDPRFEPHILRRA